jgi:hypothetical protein
MFARLPIQGDSLVPICDGCGGEADAQHMRQRIERLELATRFRPVHIQVLLIDEAPPTRMEDYFYRAAADGSARSAACALYHDELIQCADVTSNPGRQDESLLADFQRRGFFLVHAVECPVGNSKLEDAIRSLSATILKRVQYSYRPKSIALLSAPTSGLIGVFEESGWGDCLILDEGQPFAGLNFSKRFRETLSRIS